MATFLSLPPEVHFLIARMARDQDGAFEESELESLDIMPTSCTQSDRGSRSAITTSWRSLVALSSVNKALRKACFGYMFETLRADRVNDCFKLCLDARMAALVKTLDFTESGAENCVDVISLARQLPNLTGMIISDRALEVFGSAFHGEFSQPGDQISFGGLSPNLRHAFTRAAANITTLYAFDLQPDYDSSEEDPTEPLRALHAILPAFPSLRMLNISTCRDTDIYVTPAFVKSWATLPNLRHLSLVNGGDDGVVLPEEEEAVCAAIRSLRLKSFTLSLDNFDVCVTHLIEALPSTLEELDLQCAESMDQWVTLPRLPHLTTLSLTGPFASVCRLLELLSAAPIRYLSCRVVASKDDSSVAQLWPSQVEAVLIPFSATLESAKIGLPHKGPLRHIDVEDAPTTFIAYRQTRQSVSAYNTTLLQYDNGKEPEDAHIASAQEEFEGLLDFTKQTFGRAVLQKDLAKARKVFEAARELARMQRIEEL